MLSKLTSHLWQCDAHADNGGAGGAEHQLRRAADGGGGHQEGGGGHQVDPGLQGHTAQVSAQET